MFREMRRKKQALCMAECESILEKATSGVLATAGECGYPYAVPLSFRYDQANQKLYFHCAKSGHKLDAIQNNSKVSFCVIDRDDVIPEKYTTHFKSVIVFGTIRIMDEEADVADAIEKLALKYAPNDTKANRRQYLAAYAAQMHMLELTAEHITGKASLR